MTTVVHGSRATFAVFLVLCISVAGLCGYWLLNPENGIGHSRHSPELGLAASLICAAYCLAATVRPPRLEINEEGFVLYRSLRPPDPVKWSEIEDIWQDEEGVISEGSIFYSFRPDDQNAWNPGLSQRPTGRFGNTWSLTPEELLGVLRTGLEASRK